MSERRQRFDRLYTADIDPWDFRTSPYEQEKYEATLAALPRSQYRLAVEAGCSIGELTRRLSYRCDQIIGIDISDVALNEARTRNKDRDTIRFLLGELPQHWPEVPADLIVLSEVLYFLSPAEINDLARRISAHSAPLSDCILVNYLGPTDEPLQGKEAADLFITAMSQWQHTQRLTHNQYIIDILTRAPSDSEGYRW